MYCFFARTFLGQMRPVDQQEQDGLLDRPFSGIPEDAKTGDVAIVFVPIWREIEKTVYFALKQPAETATSDDDDTYSFRKQNDS